jgi:anti-sigma B factor antagonist
MSLAPHAPARHEVQYVGMSGGKAPCDGRLGVALTYEGDVACVTLVGELDLAGVPRFDAIVAAAFVRADRCRVDLRELWFVDSTGIRALLRARRRATESGATLEIANAMPAVAAVLDESGVEHVSHDA